MGGVEISLLRQPPVHQQSLCVVLWIDSVKLMLTYHIVNDIVIDRLSITNYHR